MAPASYPSALFAPSCRDLRLRSSNKSASLTGTSTPKQQLQQASYSFYHKEMPSIPAGSSTPIESVAPSVRLLSLTLQRSAYEALSDRSSSCWKISQRRTTRSGRRRGRGRPGSWRIVYPLLEPRGIKQSASIIFQHTSTQPNTRVSSSGSIERIRRRRRGTPSSVWSNRCRACFRL